MYATAGDSDSAIPLATQGLALARQVGMPTTIAMNLAALASVLAELEPERARALLRESIEVRGGLGYEGGQELAEGVLVAARLRGWRSRSNSRRRQFRTSTGSATVPNSPACSMLWPEP